METNKILTADVLDIIFEGRNKMYGAYDLRKTYNERLRNALLLTAVFFLVVFVTSVFAKSKSSKEKEINVTGIELGHVKPDPVIPTPPPVEKKIIKPEVNSVKSTTPIIVADNKAETIEEIHDDQVISNETIVSNEKNALVQPETIVEPTSSVFEEPKPKEDNKVYITVERDAEFPGGNEAWRRYVQKNMDGFNPSENGASPGKYKVIIRFIVSKDGSISDVQAETNFGYGMEEKAINCIKKGPNWKPALQNGNNVNAYRKQPITFEVFEE